MSRFWLYLGIILACSGIGTGFGIFLIIVYFWDDIKKTIEQNNEGETQNTFHEKTNAKFYDEDTVEEMR